MMRILFPGSSSVGIAVSLVVACIFCFSSIRINNQLQIRNYQKQLFDYAVAQEMSNLDEIRGIEKY